MSNPNRDLRPLTLIAEANSSGHRLLYVQLLVTKAAQCGHDVVVALPADASSGEEFEKHLGPVTDKFRLMSMTNPSSLTSLSHVSQEIGASIVVIPDGDAAALRLGLGWRWRARAELRVLVMRDPLWTRDETGRLRVKAHLKLMALRRAQRLDGCRLFWLREPGYVAKAKELIAHDPIVLEVAKEEIFRRSERFRHHLSLRGGVHWFGVVGAITGRKNVDLIAYALAEVARGWPKPLGLAVLGPVSPSIAWNEADLRRILSDAGVDFIVDDRVYSNLDVNVAVASLDCVVMAYSSHSPNATLGKATALGVPLIAAGPPSIREFVQSLHGGHVAKLSRLDLQDAMVRHLESPSSNAPRDFEGDDFAGELLGGIR